MKNKFISLVVFLFVVFGVNFATKTEAYAAAIYTLSPTSITTTSAILNATVISGSSAATGYGFNLTNKSTGQTTFYSANNIPSNLTVFHNGDFSHSVTGLSPGTTYQVNARMTDGNWYYGGVIEFSTVSVPPGSPTITSTTVLGNNVTINWSAPLGGNASRYKVYYQTKYSSAVSVATLLPDASRGVTLTLSGLSGIISGLANDTTYQFSVSAVNAAGQEGPKSGGYLATTASAPPSSVTALRGNASATVSWMSVAGATGYRIYVSDNGGAYTIYPNTNSPSTFTTNSAALSGLYNGHQYTFKVSAINIIGESNQSAASNPITLYLDTPTNFTAVRTNSGVRLTWKKVANTSCYRVLYTTTNANWDGANQIGSYCNSEIVTSATDSTLAQLDHFIQTPAVDTNYKYYIFAINTNPLDIGNSGLAGTSLTISSPSISITADKTSINVGDTITFSATIGGVSGCYTPEWFWGDHSSTPGSGCSPATPISTRTITQTHTYTSAGDFDATSTISNVTSNKVRINVRSYDFTAVSSNVNIIKGAPIPASGYYDTTVTTSVVSGVAKSMTIGNPQQLLNSTWGPGPIGQPLLGIGVGSSPNCTIIGGPCTLRVQIADNSPAGVYSLRSPIVSGGVTRYAQFTVTISDPAPSAPTELSATAGNGQITLVWKVSSGTISGYRVSTSTSQTGPFFQVPPSYALLIPGSTPVRMIIDHQANGMPVFVRVVAYNSGGESAPVTTSSTVTPTAPPSALSYTTPNTFIAGTAISNLAPSVSGTVTNYSVSPALPAGLTINSGSGVISGTPTTAQTSTTYTVTAYNDSGFTSKTITISINAAAPILSQPTNLTNSSFTLNYSAVPGATSYDIEVCPELFSTNASCQLWSGSTPVTTSDFSHITNKLPHTVRVMAHIGTTLQSAWSAVQTITLPPPAPVISSITTTPSPAVAATPFTLNFIGSNFATGATVKIGGSLYPGTVTINSATSLSLSGVTLSAGTYPVAVTSSQGAGDSNSVSLVVVSPVPGVPTFSNSPAVASSNQVTLNWIAPTTGGAVEKYSILRDTNSNFSTAKHIATTTVPVVTYTDTGLTNGTTYYYKVRSYNVAGYGDSAPATPIVAVPVAPLPAPVNPVAVPDNKSVKIAWAPVTGASTYKVYCVTGCQSNQEVLLPSGGISVNISLIVPTVASKIGSSLIAPVQSFVLATVSGLSNGSGYTFNVAASNGSDSPKSPVSPAPVVPKAQAMVTITSSANPSTLAQPAIITATVTDPAGGLVPTGTVTFTIDGTSPTSPVTLDNAGKATFQDPISGGTHTFIASYGGDAAHAPSVSNSLSQVVDKVATVVTVTSSQNPSYTIDPVRFTATVANSPAGTLPTLKPTGTITFYDGSVAICSQVPLLPLTTSVSCNLSIPATVGTHPITAVYNGDNNHTASPASAILSQAVNSLAPPDLTVALDFSSTPPYKIVQAGTVGNVVGVLKFHATNVSIDLSKVALQLTSGAPGDLSQISLWDSTGHNVGSAVFTGNNKNALASITPGSFIIPANGDKTMIVEADLTPIGISQSGTEGSLLKVDYDGAAQPGTVGFVAGSNPPISVNSSSLSDTASAGVRIFKSSPTITMLSLPTNNLDVGTKSLMRFKVTASPQGSISISKFTAKISSDSSLSNINAYAYLDVPNQQFTTPVATNSSDPTKAYIASGDSSGAMLKNGLAYSCDPTQQIDIYPQTVSETPTALVIPAGQSVYIDLRASVDTRGSYVSTQLEGDAAYPSGSSLMGTVANLELDANNDLIWSPNTVSVSALTTSDWTNGYGVNGLVGSNNSASILSGVGASSCTPPVSKAMTITTVISSSNPSTEGQAIAFTATVANQAGAPTGTPTPTGAVTFTVDGVAQNPIALDLTAAASLPSNSTLAVGSHSISAAYTGDTAHASSNSAVLSQTVNSANPVPVLTTITTNPTTVIAGASFALGLSGSSFISGATVKVDSVALPSSAVVNVVSSNIITVSNLNLTEGSHAIVVNNSATGGIGGGDSNALTLVVGPARPAFSISVVSPTNPAKTSGDAYDPYIALNSQGNRVLTLDLAAGNEAVILNYIPIKFTSGTNINGADCTSSSSLPGCGMRFLPADVISNYRISVNGSEIAAASLASAVVNCSGRYQNSCKRQSAGQGGTAAGANGQIFKLNIPSGLTIAANSTVRVNIAFDAVSAALTSDNQSPFTVDYIGNNPMYSSSDTEFSTLHTRMAISQQSQTDLYVKGQACAQISANTGMTPTCSSIAMSQFRFIPSQDDQLVGINNSVDKAISDLLMPSGSNPLTVSDFSVTSANRVLNPGNSPLTIPGYLPTDSSFGSLQVSFPVSPFIPLDGGTNPIIGFEATSTNTTYAPIQAAINGISTSISNNANLLTDKLFLLQVIGLTSPGDPTSWANILAKPVTITLTVNNPVINSWQNAALYQYVSPNWVSVAPAIISNGSATFTGPSANPTLGIFAIIGSRSAPSIATNLSAVSPMALAQPSKSLAKSTIIKSNLAIKNSTSKMAKIPAKISPNVAITKGSNSGGSIKPISQTAGVWSSIKSLFGGSFKLQLK